MSEQANPNQQTIVIALVVIAVLLAGIVGVLVWQSSQANSIPQPSATQPTTPDAGTAAQPPAGMGGATGGATGASADYDPKTAPKVPAGTEPEEYVKKYYELCSKGSYEEAFKMLPTGTQAYYGTADQFKSTLEGYGITGFDVKPGASTDKEVKVIGVQQAQGMDFAYTWTIVKDGDTWLVKSREMGGQ